MCRKTKLCRFFAKDACSQGDNCKFAHGSEELVPLPDLRQTKLCHQFKVSGRCLDPLCTFAHRRSDLRTGCSEAGGGGGGLQCSMNLDVDRENETNMHTCHRVPSPSASLESGSNSSMTTAFVNEPAMAMYLSEAMDTENTWEPVEDFLGQETSREESEMPSLPWRRASTVPTGPVIWGRLTSAPDQPEAKVYIKNTFLDIDLEEHTAPRRVSSAPPTLFYVSQQKASGQKRTLLPSPWGVLRPSSPPPRAKPPQMLEQLQGCFQK